MARFLTYIVLIWLRWALLVIGEESSDTQTGSAPANSAENEVSSQSYATKSISTDFSGPDSSFEAAIECSEKPHDDKISISLALDQKPIFGTKQNGVQFSISTMTREHEETGPEISSILSTESSDLIDTLEPSETSKPSENAVPTVSIGSVESIGPSDLAESNFMSREDDALENTRLKESAMYEKDSEQLPYLDKSTESIARPPFHFTLTPRLLKELPFETVSAISPRKTIESGSAETEVADIGSPRFSTETVSYVSKNDRKLAFGSENIFLKSETPADISFRQITKIHEEPEPLSTSQVSETKDSISFEDTSGDTSASTLSSAAISDQTSEVSLSPTTDSSVAFDSSASKHEDHSMKDASFQGFSTDSSNIPNTSSIYSSSSVSSILSIPKTSIHEPEMPENSQESGLVKDSQESGLVRDSQEPENPEIPINLEGPQTPKPSPENYSDECRFVSFEQWKKLKEASSEAGLLKKNAEISQNASNASNSSTLAESTPAQPPEEALAATFEDQGRVYKDKFNYASVDCAATIVKTNSDAKGASAILTEVKDSYLLNKCSAASKFVVIELCSDILVSSVVMGNFELFSSMFKDVRFFVSDRFPVTKGWHELGQFEASNIRDMQTFHIENPLIWARYLKIEIVSHYGHEFYCPISLVRVHGKTMMEDYKDTDPDASMSAEPVPQASQILSGGKTDENITEQARQDEECKVRAPYLALNEFLKDVNYTSNYCDVPLIPGNISHTTSAETNHVKPTQESIFQNIMKRLSLLERNATLSLLYVEEQSKLLSDAFFNLETRQVKKFDSLLAQINETTFSQVRSLESAVEKIRNDARGLFQSQNSQALGAVQALKTESTSFARELSFLKKVVVADTLIILALLAYVIITREILTVEEVTGKQKQSRDLRAENEAVPVIKPFTGKNHNRQKARRRKH